MELFKDRPQDYVTQQGRQTTNVVEGYHGLALMYRDKKTDLGHHHYTSNTDMATCHKVSIHNHNLLFFFFFQNLGPIWKVLCCFRMGVPVPLRAVNNIISEQSDWEKRRNSREKADHHLKRYTVRQMSCFCLS